MMPEYITKEQVIELLHYNSDEKCAAIIADVEELEPADVVEAVRCKDCKDFRPWGGQSKLGDCMVCVCDGEDPFTMEETDFCSDGERRS